MVETDGVDCIKSEHGNDGIELGRMQRRESRLDGKRLCLIRHCLEGLSGHGQTRLYLPVSMI